MTNPRPLSPEDLVEIRTVVRAADAPAIQRLIADYSATPAMGGKWKPPFDRSHGPDNAWRLPEWTTNSYDRDAMNWIVRVLDPKHIEILSRILTAPGKMPTSELLALAGYAPQVDAGPVFKAIGGRFRRCDRRPIWTGGEKTPAGQLLGRTENAAARRLFLDELKAQHPEIARKVGLN